MVDDLIGKRFEYGGRGPDTFDCYGLCMEVYKRLGLVVDDLIPTTFGQHDKDNDNFNSARNHFVRIDKPEPYCFVAFTIQPPYVSHAGIVLQDCVSFISASFKRHVCVERLDSDRWKKRIEGFYRYV